MEWLLLTVKLFGKEMQHLIFFAHVHDRIVLAMLTRNEKHCNRFRSSMSLTC